MGTHPSSINLDAICCLDDGLKSMTLSFNLLPVLSEYLSSTICGNRLRHSCSICSCSRTRELYNLTALSLSSLKPLLLIRSATILIRCSSDMDFSENSSIAFCRKRYRCLQTVTSCLQYSNISEVKAVKSLNSPFSYPKRVPHAFKLCPPSLAGFSIIDNRSVSRI